MSKAKKGSGLIFAVILMFVILAMVVTLSSITVLETKMSQKSKSSVGAFYNADSGVEWVLNKIASSSGTIAASFPSFSANKVDCPAQIGGADTCVVYFLDSNGQVISNSALQVSDIKAVRSVGAKNLGGAPDTQRAIEAAVAAGGGGCYVSYGKPPVANRAAAPNDNCITGFTDKGSAGFWGICFGGGNGKNFRPPGGGCSYSGDSPSDTGEAYVCCM